MPTNPFREGLATRPAPGPGVLVIFGASGDLTRRKLVPALYNLAHEGELPANFAVVGFARTPISHDEFRRQLHEAATQHARFTPLNPAVWATFADGIFYQAGDYANPASYRELAALLDQLDRQRGTAGRRVFYLAVPPAEFEPISRQLAAAGLVQADHRVIVEKPFGHDLASARALNAALTKVFAERQLLRIDHYLGKETVQNILVMRFANEIFDPLWNQKYVDHVQITVAESLGVGRRAGYYDTSGALRDMVQNHMMQLLALVAMEPPIAWEAEVIRDEKVKVLRAIRPVAPECSVRGQYIGYRDEPGVAADSHTETFVALKLFIENWRWSGVPFYLRHGKRLPKQTAEIAVQFKSPPAVLFGNSGALRPNVLVLRIQPDEGIAIRMNAKVPGTELRVQPVKMDFQYGGSFGARSPEAYERLLHDALAGDATLFIRGDEAEQAWAICEPLLEAAPPFSYAPGSWGPAEADAFIAKDGRQWRRP